MHYVSGNNLQVRIKKLIDDFARRDIRDRLMSGTGGEIRELDQRLRDIFEAKRNEQATKSKDFAGKSDQETKKLLAGNKLIL